MTIIAGLGSSSILRGLIAAAFGMLIATIGIEPVSAMPRLTFGIVSLERGISLIPIGIGMLAFSEILLQLEQRFNNPGENISLTFSSDPKDRFISLKEWFSCIKTLIRSSIAGVIVGALPGLGAPVASFFAYDQAVKHSKHPEEFGKGRLEGIAASESANSAVAAASLIPLFTLGIPGNVAAALLVGAFVIHGMIPGPLMFQENAQFIYSIYASLIVATLFLFFIGRLGIRAFCSVVKIPQIILYPIIIFTCIIGSYLSQYSDFDVTLMLLFSFLAYLMKKFDFSIICLIIGFILEPTWETSLQQVIIASEQNHYMFFTRPVAMILMAITFFIIIKSSLRKK